MAFISKNPKLTTTTLVDQVAGSVSSPASGSSKLVNRNGILYLKSSAGAETPIGAGSGGKNYLTAISDGSAAVTLATAITAAGNIVVSGTFPDVTSGWGRNTTSAIATSTNSALRGTSNYLTALTTAAVNGDTFIQSPAFNIDGEDLGKALAVQFDVTGNTTADDWDCVAVRYDSAGTFGALIPIAGVASTTTGTASAQVPTGTTTFKGFFITGSTASDVYSIRWRKRAGAVDIRLDNLIVGPGSVMTGTALTDWQSYTATYSGVTATGTTYYRRSGDSIEVEGFLDCTASAASVFKIFLPTGLTIASTKIPAIQKNYLGIMIASDSVGGNGVYTAAAGLAVVYDSADATAVFVTRNNATDASGNVLGTSINASTFLSATSQATFSFKSPITGWSSNVTMADRAVEEYASNSSTSDAADTTSFVNGVSGSTCPGALTATRKKRVRFQTPINATDVLILEFKNSSTGVFTPLAAYDNTSGIGLLQRQNIAIYGIGIDQASTSVATDVDVSFGQYGFPSGSTFGAAGSAWTTGTGFWRVRKVAAGAAVGFPVGARNIVGDTTGTAVPAGYIGESAFASGTNTALTSGVAARIHTYVLPSTGVWMITVSAQFAGSATACTQQILSINTVDAFSVASSITVSHTQTAGTAAAPVASDSTLQLHPLFVSTATASSVFVYARGSFSGGTLSAQSYIRPVRIA